MKMTGAERTKRYRERHPDRVALSAAKSREKKNQKAREARAANPEKYREQYRRHNEKSKEYRRNYYYVQRYGITAAEFDAMVSAQNGVCAICKQPETAVQSGRLRALCIDHDHATGQVRGLLCTSCNSRLHVFETWQYQESARLYLAEHSPVVG